MCEREKLSQQVVFYRCDSFHVQTETVFCLNTCCFLAHESLLNLSVDSGEKLQIHNLFWSKFYHFYCSSFRFQKWILEKKLSVIIFNSTTHSKKKLQHCSINNRTEHSREGDHQFAASWTFIETFAGSMLTSLLRYVSHETLPTLP